MANLTAGHHVASGLLPPATYPHPEPRFEWPGVSGLGSPLDSPLGFHHFPAHRWQAAKSFVCNLATSGRHLWLRPCHLWPLDQRKNLATCGRHLWLITCHLWLATCGYG